MEQLKIFKTIIVIHCHHWCWLSIKPNKDYQVIKKMCFLFLAERSQKLYLIECFNLIYSGYCMLNLFCNYDKNWTMIVSENHWCGIKNILSLKPPLNIAKYRFSRVDFKQKNLCSSLWQKYLAETRKLL